MATTRPLMQLGIGDLEEIFDKQGKNPAALARLKYELSHRQVPRAVALLEKIRRAESLLDDLDSLKREPKLTGSTVQLKPRALGTASGSAALKKNPGMYSSGGLSSPPEQPDLLTGLQPLSTATPAKKAEATSHTTDTTPVKKLATTAEPEALPQLALEDACRILKVVAGARGKRLRQLVG